MGHLRNIFIGYSLCQILKKCGYNVHSVTLVNDRGIHICKSMIAYEFDGIRCDIGSKIGSLKASMYVAMNHPEIKYESNEESIYNNLKSYDFQIIKQAFICADNGLKN